MKNAKKRKGRPPIFGKPLTVAERQERWRQKHYAEPLRAENERLKAELAQLKSKRRAK